MNETAATAPGSTGTDTRPGALVTLVTLELHTYEAVELYHGRKDTKKKAGILGLDGFARICSMVSRTPAARDLLEKKLKYVETRLDALRRQNDEAAKRNRLKIAEHASTDPTDIEFRSTTPIAGRGAQLLQAYDSLMSGIILLHRVGVYDAEEYVSRQRLATRYVRGAFAAGFDALGLTNDKSTDSPAEVSSTENKKT